MKYIFVTGGVVSSLGKGLAAASLGTLLERRGLKVIIAGAGVKMTFTIDQRFRPFGTQTQRVLGGGAYQHQIIAVGSLRPPIYTANIEIIGEVL